MKKEKSGGALRSAAEILKSVRIIAVIAAAAVFLGTGLYIVKQVRENRDGDFEVTSLAALEKIINVSELSTFTSVYNGVAKVCDDEYPEAVDYYVSYEARVYAGLDFEDIEMTLDPETNILTVKLPPVGVTGADVDVSSMDFIFYDKTVNSPTVTEQAFKACSEDVLHEARQQTAILALARENARNVIRALVQPVMEQLGHDYVLEVI